MPENYKPKLPSQDQPNPWLEEYKSFLTGKSPGTAEVYGRLVRQFTTWLMIIKESRASFQPEQFTRTALEAYLAHLDKEGYSLSHRALVKAAVGSFAHFLIEEKGVLTRNPCAGYFFHPSSKIF